MLVNGFHFFRSSKLQFKNQLAYVSLPLKCFDKQRVPILVRHFWTILPLPVKQQIVVAVKDFLRMGNPFFHFCPGSRWASRVIIHWNPKIRGQLLCRFPRWNFKEPGHKCDNIPLSAAAETVKAPAELQAGRVLTVEGTQRHPDSIHFPAVAGSHLPAGQSLLQRWIVTHVLLLRSKWSQDTHWPGIPVCSVVKAHEQNCPSDAKRA